MKNVRAIGMNQYASVVMSIICIAANVRASLDDQYTQVESMCKAFC